MAIGHGREAGCCWLAISAQYLMAAVRALEVVRSWLAISVSWLIAREIELERTGW